MSVVGEKKLFSFTPNDSYSPCYSDDSIKGNQVIVDFRKKLYKMCFEKNIMKVSVLERLIVRV